MVIRPLPWLLKISMQTFQTQFCSNPLSRAVEKLFHPDCQVAQALYEQEQSHACAVRLRKCSVRTRKSPVEVGNKLFGGGGLLVIGKKKQ